MNKRTSFLRWLNGDNVIKTDNGYKTQCSLYRKSFALLDAYRYFVNHYC